MIELLVVIGILATLAGLVIANLTSVVGDAGVQTTTASLASLRDAILGRSGAAHPSGYLADLGATPATVADLFRAPVSAPAFSPETRTGWRGPYVVTSTGRYRVDPPDGFTADYGLDEDPAAIDGWTRPIVLQVPDADGDGLASVVESRHARLVSAGPDGLLQMPRTAAQALPPGDVLLPSRAQCGDDLVLYLRVADTRPE